MTTLEVGLIECDHTTPHLRDVAGDYADMFRALFAGHAPGIELVTYDAVGGGLPAGAAQHDAWLVTGSRHAVYDDLAWVSDLLAFIREVHAGSQRLVGICFGHQAIAQALGGETAPSERGWGVGAHRARIVQSRDWMQPRLDEMRLLMSHQDQILRLPPNATVLATSEHCEVSMFEVDGRLLGIQGHPEFTAPYAAALLDARADRIRPDVVAAAQATFSAETDGGTVARWISRYLTT